MLMPSKLPRLSWLSFFGITEILLKMDFYNDFLNIGCHNIQDLEGASCYLAGIKELNSL